MSEWANAPLIELLDISRPHSLLHGNAWTCVDLAYRYDDTGEVVVVPNLLCNQTWPMCCEWFMFEAHCDEQRAQQYLAGRPPNMTEEQANSLAARYIQRAEQIHAEIKRVAALFDPKYPVAVSREKMDFGPLIIPSM